MSVLLMAMLPISANLANHIVLELINADEGIELVNSNRSTLIKIRTLKYLARVLKENDIFGFLNVHGNVPLGWDRKDRSETS
jgi:hypothetical protein